MNLFLGIDPGLSGALALYNPAADTLAIHDMPTLVLPKGKGKRTELDLTALAHLFDGFASQQIKAFVERVSASSQMGVTSAFSFGGSYLAVRMACAAHFIPTELVTPQVWKRALKVQGGADKTDAVRARASALLPQHANLWPLKKHDGRAEAALIALYGVRTLQGMAE